MGIFKKVLENKAKVKSTPIKAGLYTGKILNVGLEEKNGSGGAYKILNFVIAFISSGIIEIHVIKMFKDNCQIKPLYDIASDFGAVIDCEPQDITAGTIKNKIFSFDIGTKKSGSGTEYNVINSVLSPDTQNADYQTLKAYNGVPKAYDTWVCSDDIAFIDVKPDVSYLAVITSYETIAGRNGDFISLKLSAYRRDQEAQELKVSLFPDNEAHREILEDLDSLVENEEELYEYEFNVIFSFNGGYYEFADISLPEGDEENCFMDDDGEDDEEPSL